MQDEWLTPTILLAADICREEDVPLWDGHRVGQLRTDVFSENFTN